MMVWLLFIIGLMGLFFYNKIGSIIPMVVLPTTEIIEPKCESELRSEGPLFQTRLGLFFRSSGLLFHEP